MKLARLSTSLHEISPFGNSIFYSTKARPHSKSKRSGESSTSMDLYRRISPVGDPNVSIVPILDNSLKEGGPIDQIALKDIILKLRHYKRYNHALEISMWMADKKYYNLSLSDVAIRLKLISKARGIEEAENYFNNLSEDQRMVQVYGALLNSYADAKCVEKAETVMQKMKYLGFALNGADYNVMLSLYYKSGNMDKFNALLKEMEENGIVRDRFALAIQLSAYAAVKDTVGMDKIVSVMESDPSVVSDWTNYTAAAAGYRKAGHFDKAVEMLKRAEARVTNKAYIVYEDLLTQYATLKRRDEFVRIWSLYKKDKVHNKGYMRALSSAVKLDDIEMAEQIFDEWESQNLNYDIHIPNVLIGAYSRKGLLEKAEALIGRATSKGGRPDCWTWCPLVKGYFQIDQPQKAVEIMKKAIVLSKPGWNVENAQVKACLAYLKGVGDKEKTEEFVKLLLDKNLISSDIMEKIMTRSGKSSTVDLYSRISVVGDQNVSIVPILDQSMEEGQSIDQTGLKNMILKLRHYRRYSHALQISMWMADKKCYNLSLSDVAIRLELISKVRGIEETEKFFKNLSEDQRGVEVYGALLNCYANVKRVEKAEAVILKMRDLGFAVNGAYHNSMLNLYSKTGNMEKFNALLKEMEESGTLRNRYTLAVQLSSFAAVKDVEGMDKIVSIMESDPSVVLDWTNYTAAAAGYRKAGDFDKGLEMLKKAEALGANKPYVLYEDLLTQYARIGMTDEFVRIWSLYKKDKVYKKGYKLALCSAVKLDNIEIAEQIFEEWESQDLSYDIHIPNIMIGAYSKKGLLEKAEGLIERTISKGGRPDCWTWSPLVKGYFRIHQPQKAVEIMKKAIALARAGWSVEVAQLKACLKYLKGIGDKEKTEEFVKLV